jgi:para-nitrobenzyl esterase
MKITLLRIAIVATGLACASALAAQTPAPAPVRTQAGLVQGTSDGTLTIYQGIPFAAPPLGDLRWRAPQPVASWTGVHNADKFAPMCIQARGLGSGEGTASEDCLYLNVWTPAKSAGEKLPVMVWIYGGAFTSGATSIPTYNGANLAKKGVVVVSVAYRLGALGFMVHPTQDAEDAGHSGNYGLLDQIAGLQWVKRNIAAFGGDPGKVTIFGESAGGIAISMLASSPLAKGFYQAAISESGGSLAPPRYTNEGGELMLPMSVAQKNATAFLTKLGVATIADARKVSAEDVLKSTPQGQSVTWPVFDGYVLPGDEYKLYEAGKFNDTPILIGTNSDEGALFVRTATAAGFQQTVKAGFGDYSDKILAAYPAGSDTEALRSARDLFRDDTFAWHTWAWARLQAQTSKNKIFMYYFTHRPPYPDLPMYKDWGASHGGEIAYVFQNFPANETPTSDDKSLSDQMASYWVNFAKKFDPNGPALPQWPAYTNTDSKVMNLDVPSKIIGVPNLEQIQVLDSYYAWRRSQGATPAPPNSLSVH